MAPEQKHAKGEVGYTAMFLQLAGPLDTGAMLWQNGRKPFFEKTDDVTNSSQIEFA